MRFGIFFVAALVLLSGSPGCGSPEVETSAALHPPVPEAVSLREPESVAWARVERKVLPGRIAASGSLTPARVTELGAESPGRILEVLVDVATDVEVVVDAATDVEVVTVVPVVP